MKIVRDGGEDVSTPVEAIAIVVTNSATVELNFHRHASRVGPLFVFSAPRVGEAVPVFRDCGCNPHVGHVVARTIDEARRVRDALSAAIAYAEARA